MSQDPIWNEPAAQKIAGRDFRFKELPFLVLRRHLEGLLGLLLAAERKHPGLLDQQTIEASNVLAILLEEGMMSNSVDAIEKIAQESVEQDSLGDLPASAWVEVVSRALEAQLPVVRAFLASGERFREALAGFGLGRRAGATPSSSRSSPETASPGPPTSGG